MKKYLLFLIITFIVFGAQAQIDTIARSFSTTITAYDLKDNLTYIASPSTEGRETGTPGLVRAAEYIASKFGLIGIQQMGGTGTYYQSYKYIRSKSRDVTLFDSLQRYEYLKDFYVQADVRNGLVYKKQVVFMGYGIDAPGFNDYANDTNLTDKIVVLFNDEPYHKGKSLITGNISHSDWYHNTTLKLNRISKYKPAAVIFIDDAHNLDPRSSAEGRAIFNDILRIAEDCRETVTIILAGRRSDIEKKLIAYNPGNKCTAVAASISRLNLSQA